MASFIVFAVANICCRKVWLCPNGIVKLVMLQQGCTEVRQHYPSKSLRMCFLFAELSVVLCAVYQGHKAGLAVFVWAGMTFVMSLGCAVAAMAVCSSELYSRGAYKATLAVGIVGCVLFIYGFLHGMSDSDDTGEEQCQAAPAACQCACITAATQRELLEAARARAEAEASAML